MAGGTWDAAWHVTLVRETFWSPPHLLMYTGTAGSLLVGAVGVASARLARQQAPLGFVAVAVGALMIAGAAPLDELWHRTFGRDVDVWSFPHLVALVGAVTISIGAVAAVEADGRHAGGRRLGHQLVKTLFLAMLLWAAMFGLNWYTLVLAAFRDSVKYPVLACLVAPPALVLAAMALGRGGAMAASAFYMAYIASAHSLLSGFGFALLPFPPVLLAPAIAIDAVCWAVPGPGWRRAAVAGLLFAPAFYIAEAASLAWYPHPPIGQPPAGALALGYYLERLDRPWDWGHVALALPLAMAVAAPGSLFGWWLGRGITTGSGVRRWGPRSALWISGSGFRVPRGTMR